MAWQQTNYDAIERDFCSIGRVQDLYMARFSVLSYCYTIECFDVLCQQGTQATKCIPGMHIGASVSMATGSGMT